MATDQCCTELTTGPCHPPHFICRLLVPALQEREPGPASTLRFPRRMQAAVHMVLLCAQHGQVVRQEELTTEQLALLGCHRRQQLYQEAKARETGRQAQSAAWQYPSASAEDASVRWAIRRGWEPPKLAAAKRKMRIRMEKKRKVLLLSVGAAGGVSDTSPTAAAGGEPDLLAAGATGGEPDLPPACATGGVPGLPPASAAEGVPAPPPPAGSWQWLKHELVSATMRAEADAKRAVQKSAERMHRAQLRAAELQDDRLVQRLEGDEYRRWLGRQPADSSAQVAALAKLERELERRLIAGGMPGLPPALPTAPHPLHCLPKQLLLHILQLATTPLSAWAQAEELGVQGV